MFAAGVDIHGVHNFADRFVGPTDRYEPTDRAQAADIAWRSSPVAYMDGWRSPVLLIHGDDDRNVAFTQTTGLVQLLRAHNVEHELIVYPDDVHDPLLHSRWLYSFDRTVEFLGRYLQPPPAPAASR